jgi:hypothetical protein
MAKQKPSGFDTELENILADVAAKYGASMITPGRAYLFFGVTQYTIGRVIGVCGKWALLSHASWMADPGRRQTEMLKAGKPPAEAEIEPYPENTWPVSVNTDACNHICVWPHDLPDKQQ